MILSPRPKTLAQLRRLAGQPERPILRWLEYERIRGLTLDGLTLDAGGSKVNTYHELLNIHGQIHLVNISQELQPTFLADLNHPIPVAPNTYDNVISLNTLEHIYSDLSLLREFHRVIKPGGALVIVVPFLYRVHASPSDYHRHTAYFWAEMLAQIGFQQEQIQVEPLMFGPFAAPLSLAEAFIRPKWLRPVVRFCLLGWPILRNWVRTRLKPDAPPSPYDSAEYALGYYISARK